MPDTFRNILIPVDFSANMDTALRRAGSLADSKGCEFHLLYVVKPGKKALEGLHRWEAEKKLQLCKETLEDGNTNVKVKIYVLRGLHVETLIIEVARMISADLVIIGRQPTRRPWRLFDHISPNVIAKKTNCPVLTVKPASTGVRT
ncbi:MAG TPA: universal stress protein, partial [Puia sp.]|nr:universal stress protein [Puia sp.]